MNSESSNSYSLTLFDNIILAQEMQCDVWVGGWTWRDDDKVLLRFEAYRLACVLSPMITILSWILQICFLNGSTFLWYTWS